MTPEASAKTLTQLVATEIKLQMVRSDDMKQSQLARKIGKTEQWLSVRLRGIQPIDLNDLYLIAQGLEVGVHQLLPPPDVAAGAKAMARYIPLPVWTTDRGRAPNNRPSGPSGSTRPGPGRRTARVPRGRRPSTD